MAGCEQANIRGVAGRDDCRVEVESGGHDESVHGVFGTEPRFREKSAGALSNRAGEIANEDASVCQEPIDGGVEAMTPTDFGEHGCGDANEGPTFEGDGKNCASPFGENGAFSRASERMNGLGIED